MKTASLLVLIGLLAAGSASAAELNRDIRLSRDVLTVGDVFSDAGKHAGHVLAPAPAPGKTMTLGTHDIARIATAFGIDWQASNTAEQVVIRSDAAEVDRYSIEAALQEALAGKFGGGFDLELQNQMSPVILSGGSDVTISVEDIRMETTGNGFTARILAANDTQSLRRNISGKVYPLVKIPVLAAALRNGDIIRAQDIVEVEARASDVAANVVLDAAKLVGMTPRKGVNAHKPLTQADLMMPEMVKKGESVTMTLSTGILNLTAQGKALETGAVGDIVRVLNISSNQVIEGVVTAPRTITVRSPSGTI